MIAAATLVACHGGSAPAALGRTVPVVNRAPVVTVGLAADTPFVDRGYAARVAAFIGPLFLDSYPAHWERDVSFVVRRDGSVRPEPAIAGDTLARGIARTLGRIPANPALALPASAPDSIAVAAHIVSDPVDPPLRYATAAGDSARYPLAVDDVASPRPKMILVPSYPTDDQVHDRPGHAVAEFVVLPDGSVDRTTIRIVDATNPAFASAVATRAAGWHFFPAKLGGRPVPQVLDVAVFFFTRTEDMPQNAPPGSIFAQGFKVTRRISF